MIATAAASTFGIAWLLLLVLAILWILIPFAVFGIKGLLRDILAEQRRTNALLSGLGTAESAGADKPRIPEFKQPGRLFGG